MNLEMITISSNSVYSDLMIRDTSGGLLAMSITGFKSKIDNIQRLLKKKDSHYIGNVGTTYFHADYKTYRKERADKNSHLLAIRQDGLIQDDDGQEIVTINILTADDYSKNEEHLPKNLGSIFFKKLSRYTPIPVLEEWSTFIFKQLQESRAISVFSSSIKQEENMKLYAINTTVEKIYAIIKKGFDLGEIGYETDGMSPRLAEASSLDSYLQAFGPEEFKRDIEERFAPLFDKSRDEYGQRTQDVFDYIRYHGIDLYDAQKNIIEAGARNLRRGNSLKIAEQGTGKTVMGVATVYAAMKSDKPTVNMVLCPGHLVEKWADEVNERFPLAKAIILDNFKHYMSVVKPMIDDPKRRHHLFLVVSKNTVKNNYTLRPAVVYNRRTKLYTCPDCGHTLMKTKKVGKGKYRREIEVPMEAVDFLKYSRANNGRCKNIIDGSGDTPTLCDAHLWSAHNKNHQTKWLQLPSGLGWVHASDLMHFEHTLLSQFDGATSTVKKFEKAIQKLREVVEDGDYKQYAPYTYSIAKYILRHQNIDFLIADELHDYKSDDSEQGIAFGRLVSAATRTLGMTGTLLNGYASSVFYILYRMFPQVMKKQGYYYEEVEKFVKDYGVVKKTVDYNEDGHIKSSRPKEIPGVSPHVFTKFLLNHAAFLRMDDVSEGLPSYQEIPIACRMNEDVHDEYKRIEKKFSDIAGSGKKEKGHSNIMANFTPLMSAYPDQPFNQPDIFNPETGDIVFKPQNIERTSVNDKEAQTINIAKESIANGERVLIYTTLVNRTDAAERLVELFKDEGINASILKSSTVASRDRAKWIDKKLDAGMQVLICNPKLVETGLDLLPFTSIFFYQIPYNLFTLRQASRRSLRLNQENPVKVYFMYYEETMQARAVGLMASKQKASQAIEGNFSEEGLNALSETEDLLSSIASNIVAGIEANVDLEDFITANQDKQDQGHMSVRQVLTRKPSVSTIPDYSLAAVCHKADSKKKRRSPLLVRTHNQMHDLFNNKLSVANLY